MLLQSGGTLDDVIKKAMEDIDTSFKKLDEKSDVRGLEESINALKDRFTQLGKKYGESSRNFLDFASKTKRRLDLYKPEKIGDVANLGKYLEEANAEDFLELINLKSLVSEIGDPMADVNDKKVDNLLQLNWYTDSLDKYLKTLEEPNATKLRSAIQFAKDVDFIRSNNKDASEAQGVKDRIIAEDYPKEWTKYINERVFDEMDDDAKATAWTTFLASAKYPVVEVEEGEGGEGGEKGEGAEGSQEGEAASQGASGASPGKEGPSKSAKKNKRRRKKKQEQAAVDVRTDASESGREQITQVPSTPQEPTGQQE